MYKEKVIKQYGLKTLKAENKFLLKTRDNDMH